MIKITVLVLALISFLFITPPQFVFAQPIPPCGVDFSPENCPKPTAYPQKFQRDVNDALGTFNLPGAVRNIDTSNMGLSKLIGRMIDLLFGISALAVLVMMFMGAWQYLTSGGDKEAIAKATKRIQWAIIGIVVLSFSMLFLRVLGQIINVDFFNIKL